MTLDGASRQLLAVLLEQRRVEIIESATDWVIGEAIDLRSRRPREETRRLVEQVVSGNEAALLEGDLGPLHAFIDFVTSYRAASEFRVSTPLKGMLSFRHVLADLLRREDADPGRALDILMAADDVYFAIVFRTADLYEEKLTSTIQQRRRALEVELAKITFERARELDDKIETIKSQQALLSTLSWPVIKVWDGVLVLPILGEIGGERAEAMLYKVLASIQGTRARVVLVDLTGLTEVDQEAMRHLGRLTRVAGLLGAEVMLVGMSVQAAMTLIDLDVGLGKIRAFATLHDGLRVALSVGLSGARAPR